MYHILRTDTDNYLVIYTEYNKYKSVSFNTDLYAVNLEIG